MSNEIETDQRSGKLSASICSNESHTAYSPLRDHHDLIRPALHEAEIRKRSLLARYS